MALRSGLRGRCRASAGASQSRCRRTRRTRHARRTETATHVVGEVESSSAARTPAPSGEAAAETAEEAIEEVAETTATRRARLGTGTCVAPKDFVFRCATLPVGAEQVVLLALFGIAEDLVGLVDFLELVLSALVAGVDVRMVFAGELAVGALYLGRGRVTFDAQELVVVAKFHLRCVLSP